MSPPGVAPTPAVLRAVGHDHRWSLLQHLACSDLRVGELVDRLGSSQNLVSYHLRELRKVGLVSARRSSADGRDTYYRFDARRCAALLSDAGGALTPALRLQMPRPAVDPATGQRAQVLFLCTGNSARSVMAAALLSHRSGGTVGARSAGSHPKPVHPQAVQVMAQRGIDISGHTSTHLDEVVHEPFDRVITLCDRVREICPDLPAGPATAHWSMPNPADADDHAAFAQTADELDDRIGLLLAELSATR